MGQYKKVKSKQSTSYKYVNFSSSNYIYIMKITLKNDFFLSDSCFKSTSAKR